LHAARRFHFEGNLSLFLPPSIRVYPHTGEQLQDSRFVLDQHLGRLAADLRMPRFDVLHTVPSPDPELSAPCSPFDRLGLAAKTKPIYRSQNSGVNLLDKIV
jgi:hypothetical protein